ncbi:MAG: hydrolase [Anaerophaga sp.]|uniref:NUDIX hydrolase n=1 Tax=Anaerophaga thermohalophila TaxID=177400 RepID=UPI000237CC85|nr:NUDIX domain-containing protein [Anaerophaga thermohalophila]MBZ4676150.1 hydrolase [Anaerophaga sp.]MDI3520818.1 8-oxo-dGTP diphosphatase [Anaerophaga sp.]MDK2840944.1 8-oxo-dGTP diphosphatase [Anaerophaga sp.]MDN5290274.1 8-oxo-dGTP diphosphatase [Anaerophaga sp.]
MVKAQLNNSISVDCVIFGFDFEKLNVLLVDRVLKDEKTGKELFSDLTLTGNHIFEHESLEDAAARILFDLTGLENIYLKQFGAFCDTDRLKRPNDQAWLRASGRDPDSRIISVGYYSLLATEKVTLKWKGRNVKWYPVSEVTDLAFDHYHILQSALRALRRELLYEPIGFELLPEKFTLSQLQKLYEVVLGVELDKRNFRKKIARMKYLIPLDEKQKGVAHKPARLYMFSREVYEKTRKEVLDFNI